jgi:hypothetical protein
LNIKNIAVYNLYPAILGIRNSFKSKNKSDSLQFQVQDLGNNNFSYNHCQIGEEDIKLIKKLLNNKNTPEYRHQERKFLRQILVSMDITGSIKFWAQADTFKIGTVRNSESTMHSIAKGEVTQADFERPIWNNTLDYLNELITDYNSIKNNKLITLVGLGYEVSEKDICLKRIFELIDANLPGGYVLTSLWTGNYEVLRNIYHGRKRHRMYYWQEFCSCIEQLPYFDLLIKGE